MTINNNNFLLISMELADHGGSTKWGEYKSNEMLVFLWGENHAEYPGKNLSKQSRKPTNLTHIWRRVWESNRGNIGGKQVLSHHCGNPVLYGEKNYPFQPLLQLLRNYIPELNVLIP